MNLEEILEVHCLRRLFLFDGSPDDWGDDGLDDILLLLSFFFVLGTFVSHRFLLLQLQQINNGS